MDSPAAQAMMLLANCIIIVFIQQICLYTGPYERANLTQELSQRGTARETRTSNGARDYENEPRRQPQTQWEFH